MRFADLRTGRRNNMTSMMVVNADKLYLMSLFHKGCINERRTYDEMK
jgi:hypothetical protein